MNEAGREIGKYGRFPDQPPVSAQVSAPVSAQVSAQVSAPVSAQVSAPVSAQVSAPVSAQVNAAVAELARAQHGAVALAQLAGLGLTQGAVHKRTAVGRLHRIHRGVYSLAPGALLSRQGRWMAAVLACGPGAALSHRSAAALHELRASERAMIDVTIPGRGGRSHVGVEVHRSSTLTEKDTTMVNGIPATTVARTQLDLAEVINRRELERVFDQAEILEVFDLGALESQLERNRYRPCAGAVRAVLDEHHAGRTPTWSEFEERFLTLTRTAGLPDPEVNPWIVTDDGEPALRVDFLWRGQRLVVETDGHRTHRTRQAFERDRRSDQRLVLAGWRVVRVTWRQLTREANRLAALLVGLLRA